MAPPGALIDLGEAFGLPSGDLVVFGAAACDGGLADLLVLDRREQGFEPALGVVEAMPSLLPRGGVALDPLSMEPLPSRLAAAPTQVPSIRGGSVQLSNGKPSPRTV